MKVEEIMSRPVVTVAPSSPLKDVATLLVEREISGVPVVEAGRVVGVVSESDVIRKELGPDGQPPAPRRTLLRRRRPRLVDAVTAEDAMSVPPITVEPWTSDCWAAWLMAEHDVNRLPVVDRGELVGIVARADLVRAFARSDTEIEREIREHILPTLSLQPDAVVVTVERGEVTLAGELDNEADVDALPRSVRRVVGVVKVQSALRARVPEPTR